MTHKPAAIIRKKKGLLQEGGDADIAIFDIEKEWRVDPAQFYSKGPQLRFRGKDAHRQGRAHHRRRQSKNAGWNVIG